MLIKSVCYFVLVYCYNNSSLSTHLIQSQQPCKCKWKLYLFLQHWPAPLESNNGVMGGNLSVLGQSQSQYCVSELRSLSQ